jgi:hypothetical protein
MSERDEDDAEPVDWRALIGRPAWWCTKCEAWWPGAWVVWFEPPTDTDLLDAHAYEHRTCAECGTRLVPRSRPAYP